MLVTPLNPLLTFLKNGRGIWFRNSLACWTNVYMLISLQNMQKFTKHWLWSHSFYDSGYHDGFAHGRIHGLIEGRALGREKGFEMWEEIGFYEGFALTWRAILRQQSKQDELSSWFSQSDLLSDLFYGSRASQHIQHLLGYISQFPRVNSSSSDDDAASSPDISKLLRQIRSRYKALCSILGVHPRLRSSNEASDDEQSGNSDMQVDKPTKDSAIPIWKLDKTGAKKPVTNQDLSFWNPFTRDCLEKISIAVQSRKTLRFDDVEVGLQTLYIIWKVLTNDCFVIDSA